MPRLLSQPTNITILDAHTKNTPPSHRAESTMKITHFRDENGVAYHFESFDLRAICIV